MISGILTGIQFGIELYKKRHQILKIVRDAKNAVTYVAPNPGPPMPLGPDDVKIQNDAANGPFVKTTGKGR